MQRALQIGFRVLAGLNKAKATRRENCEEELALRRPIILRKYLALRMADPSARLSDWRVAGLIATSIEENGITLGPRQVQRILATIPAVSKNFC